MRKERCCFWGRLGVGLRALAGIGMVGAWLSGCVGTGEGMGAEASALPRWGEYGGNLHLLSSFYRAPQAPGESNHFVDMLGDGSLRGFAVEQGLTNNHTLFLLSHGGAIETPSGSRYALWPGRSKRCHPRSASFSVSDVARFLGPAAASQVHNVMIAGCNRENLLCLGEFREFFPNATNITHAAAGCDPQESAFRRAMSYSSRDLDFLCQMPDTFSVGVFERKKTGKEALRRGAPYVAELYLPGAKKPFVTQTAGRELLQPGRPLLSSGLK